MDVLLVTTATTSGWRIGVQSLAGSLIRAGASVHVARAPAVRRVRTFALTDLVEARAARRAARAGIEEHHPRAIVYCSITAALLWPEPGAVWIDSIAADNRPGRHGIWQRPTERRRLARSPLVLLWSERVLDALRGSRPEATVVPPPIERSSAVPPASRDIAAITYAGDPQKRRLDLVLDVWRRARREGEILVVAGTEAVPARPGVEVVGKLSPNEYRALVRRARVFLAAPHREDHGIAPLEALADGCLLVTTPSPGAYPARDLARALDPRLVDEDLVRALRTALDDPAPGYAERAFELLGPFSRDAVDKQVADIVLPRLLATASRR